MTATYLITGNTFPYRSDLRALGCTWDKDAKGWRCPDPAAVKAAMPYAFDKAQGALRIEGGPSAPPARERCGQCGEQWPCTVANNPKAYPGIVVGQHHVAATPAPVTAVTAPVTAVTAPAPMAVTVVPQFSAPTPTGRISFGPRDQNTERRTALFEQYHTAREVITHAGLDWTADLQPLYLADGREIDNRAVVRSDTQRVLGVVSNRYRGPQNVDAMEFFDGVIARGEAQYAGAGMFRGGREVYIQARLLNADESIGDSSDIVRPYILLRNSHDGTGALSIGFSVTRVLCENTLAAALGEMKGDNRTRRLRHIGDIVEQLDAAGHALDGIRQEWRDTAAAYRKLAAKPMAYSAAREYFADALQGMTQSQKSLEQALARVDDLYVNGAGAVVGSAWGAYQAVTNYLSHEAGRDRTRKESILVGDGAKRNAHALVLALAA